MASTTDQGPTGASPTTTHVAAAAPRPHKENQQDRVTAQFDAIAPTWDEKASPYCDQFTGLLWNTFDPLEEQLQEKKPARSSSNQTTKGDHDSSSNNNNNNTSRDNGATTTTAKDNTAAPDTTKALQSHHHPSRLNLRVLDFGCGSGLLTAHLAEHVKHVVAMDCSPGMIQQTKKKHKLHAWTNVTVLDPLVLSTDTAHVLRQHAPFDLIVASSVFTFVPDLPEVFSILMSMLKPGGKLFHTDWFDCTCPCRERINDKGSHSEGFNVPSATLLYQGAGMELIKAKKVEFEGLPPNSPIFVGYAQKIMTKRVPPPSICHM